jgi:hypothetical protein
MSLTIVSADQRLRTQTVKGQIWGPAGVGKTTLLKTLDGPSTLCVATEGGMLSVQTHDAFGPPYSGDSIEPNTWPEHLALLKGFQANPRPPGLAKYLTVFIDSTSIISKQCFEWCQTQPEAFSEKTGKPNLLGAYGLLAREMSAWAWGWKNIPDVNVWLIGGLEQKEINGLKEWSPLLMGAKIQSELPYIFDYSLVMARFKAGDGQNYTGLFTNPITHPEYACVPVKTRGGGLAPIEQPHLGRLMAKALGHSSTTATQTATQTSDASFPPNQQSEAA